MFWFASHPFSTAWSMGMPASSWMGGFWSIRQNTSVEIRSRSWGYRCYESKRFDGAFLRAG